MADRSQIEEIKEKLDIVQVAMGYLRSPMKKSGRNTFTLCPFHSEKSPSFSLNSDLGIYKCFGCGESGDVITFIQKMEGVEFGEALEIAASKAGVVLQKEFSPAEKKRLDEKKRALEAHKLAAGFYNFLLIEHKSGERARQYCAKRKLRTSELVKFEIGYAPDGFENLKSYLLKKGFKEGDLVSWGLLVSKNNKIYDKFRNRLMFPIFNHRGEITGFSGRTLDKDGIPKYLNSPETILYKKSEIIYGLYQAKEALRKSNFAIIAEGNVEPLSSTKVGIENVVVPMGTGLTQGQLKLLKRYCDEIYFAFDTDNAGQSALQRAIKLASAEGFSIKAINLGKYKDPDEMIQDEPDKWKEAVSDAVDIIEYLIHSLKNNYDLNSAEGKSKFVKVIMPFIRDIGDEIRMEHYIKEVSEITQTKEDTVLANFNKQVQEKRTEETEKIDLPEDLKLTQQEYLAAIALSFNGMTSKIKKVIKNSNLKKILDLHPEYNLKTLRDQLDDTDKKLFDKLATANLSNLTNENVEDEVDKIIFLLNHKRAHKEINNLQKLINDKEKLGEDISDLLKQLQKLLGEMKK